MAVTIYHNPACGTSRNVLALIRNTGEEPTIVEYLQTPPSREELVELIRRMDMPVRDLLRRKGTPYDELQLDNPDLTDDQLLDAMMAHPILINRPIVVAPLGVALCRPSETVLSLLRANRAAPSARRTGSRSSTTRAAAWTSGTGGERLRRHGRATRVSDATFSGAGRPAPETRPRWVVVSAVGVAQILAWGSSYYLPAVLAGPITAETGWPLGWVVGALSIGLLVSGLVSPGSGG